MSCIDLLESTLGFLRVVRVLVWMPEGICKCDQLVASANITIAKLGILPLEG